MPGQANDRGQVEGAHLTLTMLAGATQRGSALNRKTLPFVDSIGRAPIVGALDTGAFNRNAAQGSCGLSRMRSTLPGPPIAMSGRRSCARRHDRRRIDSGG